MSSSTAEEEVNSDASACGKILIFLSWMLVLVTMPFSLLVCFKVRAVSINLSKVLSKIQFLKSTKISLLFHWSLFLSIFYHLFLFYIYWPFFLVPYSSFSFLFLPNSTLRRLLFSFNKYLPSNLKLFDGWLIVWKIFFQLHYLWLGGARVRTCCYFPAWKIDAGWSQRSRWVDLLLNNDTNEVDAS